MEKKTDNHPKRRVYPLVITVAFCICLAAPCVGTLFGWDFHPPNNENRRLATFPTVSETAAAEMPDKFEDYFKDHFGYRNTLIRRYRKLHYKIVGTQPEHVLVGTTARNARIVQLARAIDPVCLP